MADVLPTTGLEFLYPIVPLHLVDKVLNQQDSVKWTRNVLTADKVRDVLGLRVRQANFDALVTFLEGHLAPPNEVVDLTTPNLYLFGLNYTRCNVRVVDYKGHARELERFFRVNVTFELVSGIS
jgi:hypothetical protein